MDWCSIVLIILGSIAIILGLLLSSGGSSSGLSTMAGQDLELFKKTKDRGFIKVIQMVMFAIVILLTVCLLIYKIIDK